MNDSIVTRAQLSNQSFANLELRAISKKEVFLSNFIVYGKKLQCLQEAQFKLNNHLLKCEALESFTLPDTYIVEYEEQKMEQHITSRQGQLLNKQWLENYQIPVADEDFEISIATIPEANPVVEQFSWMLLENFLSPRFQFFLEEQFFSSSCLV